jgi:GntR family transcriptional regulator
MIQFNIQIDSEIPAGQQLLDQIQFAIASNQYTTGDRLPSTRQLSMITGLHRNTISKVYQQLEEKGLVESVAGSGIYVKKKNYAQENWYQDKYSQIKKIVTESVDHLLEKGCSLNKIKELFLGEIEWRLQCAAKVLVVVPDQDLGVGKLIVSQLETELNIPLQLVTMTELIKLLELNISITILASRYFLQEIETIINQYPPAHQSVRIITIEINNYSQELEIIKKLPKNTCVGIVSLSSGILRVAEVLIYSLRGEEVLVLTTQINDQYKLKALIRSSSIIITDQSSYNIVTNMLKKERDNLIRKPQLIKSENYISQDSIKILKRELGLEE